MDDCTHDGVCLACQDFDLVPGDLLTTSDIALACQNKQLSYNSLTVLADSGVGIMAEFSVLTGREASAVKLIAARLLEETIPAREGLCNTFLRTWNNYAERDDTFASPADINAGLALRLSALLEAEPAPDDAESARWAALFPKLRMAWISSGESSVGGYADVRRAGIQRGVPWPVACSLRAMEIKSILSAGDLGAFDPADRIDKISELVAGLTSSQRTALSTLILATPYNPSPRRRIVKAETFIVSAKELAAPIRPTRSM